MSQISLRAARVAAIACVTFAACSRGPATSTPASVPAPVPASPTRVTPRFASGEDVVAAMRARYAGKWYNTLTFKQKTSRLLPNGTWKVETWFEAMRLPGRLRIDFEPVSAGNGVLYARDSQFVASNGRVIQSGPGINDLLLLGFDVYANSPARTAALLRRQGLDLNRVHEASFEGRPMVVVGALRGDLRRKQAWIDSERLYLVRLVEPTRTDSSKVQDIRFLNYERRGDAWLAPRVEIFNDGKLVFVEEYSEIRTDVPLDESIFDPTPWKNPKHWMAAGR
ncbi:MAG TPA: hypothetical protein VM033_07240 [Gemmatimonadaceae bacterium]|nr:hypothetical protein [Gemmatimonadaceae bacterium]